MIGIFSPVSFAASSAGSPAARNTSILRRGNSPASIGSRSYSLLAKRDSTTRFFPSSYPKSRRGPRSSASLLCISSADPNARTPTLKTLPMQKQNSGAHDDKGLGSPAPCRLKGSFKVTRLPNLQRLESYLQPRRGALRLAELGIGVIWIPQDRHSGYPGGGFFEQLNRFPGQLVVNISDARDIATGPRLSGWQR